MPFVVNARSRKLNFRLIRMRSPVELESCTIRSRSQVDSDSQADGTQGERLCFPPFPSASRNFLAPKAGGHGTDVPMHSCLYLGKYKPCFNCKSVKAAPGLERLLDVQIT